MTDRSNKISQRENAQNRTIQDTLTSRNASYYEDSQKTEDFHNNLFKLHYQNLEESLNTSKLKLVKSLEPYIPKIKSKSPTRALKTNRQKWITSERVMMSDTLGEEKNWIQKILDEKDKQEAKQFLISYRNSTISQKKNQNQTSTSYITAQANEAKMVFQLLYAPDERNYEKLVNSDGHFAKTSIEKQYKIKDAFQRLQTMEYCCSLLALIGVVSCIIYSDFQQYIQEWTDARYIDMFCLTLSTISTFMLIIAIFIRTKLQFK